ncbi:hypothetical protein [Natronomonas salsuginis]|uniref:Uncharacterized protein n=1 Tax=Natronomonas salsuginis TaxID=2217661 RepID=A0A4U5JAU9_9EURY|nr:hypothetical protein [Natronomonas salsuginis]TKR25391.1 hypothetical protein DM868_11565 [Natronomonas salsuginis]
MTDDDPTFRIPQHPTRRYRRRGGVEYDGGTVFSVRPTRDLDEATLVELVRSILDRQPYRYGDWFDLPMPLYLVHDDVTGDTFRVAIRDGVVELHVLPETEPDGLRAFYHRLAANFEGDWTVTHRNG